MRRSQIALSIAVALSLVCATSLPKPGHAQTEAVAAVTLGVFLNSALNKIKQMISDAKQGARSTIIDAGQQASWTISDVQNAYQESLELTIDKLSPEIQKTVANIETMLTNLEKGTASDIKEALETSVQIVNALPLSSSFPQFTSQSPKLVAPALAEKTRIIIKGNFVDVARKDYGPVLRVGGEVFEPIGSSTQEIVFEVKNALLGEAEEKAIKVVSMDLEVPYRDWYWYFFYERAVASFVLPIGLLPKKPGETVVYVATVENSNTETRTSQHNFSATNYDGTRTFCADADSQNGWHVITDGQYAQPTIISENGASKGADNDWTDAFSSASPARVCWDFWLDDDDIQIDFAIMLREQRVVKTVADVETTADLLWNSSKLFDVPNTGKWKVRVKPFDGEWQEFAGPGSSVPDYFSIGTQGSSVAIKSAPPPELH